MMKGVTEIIEEGFMVIIAEIKENAGRGESTDVHDLLTRLSETIRASSGLIFDVPCLSQLFYQYGTRKHGNAGPEVQA